MTIILLLYISTDTLNYNFQHLHSAICLTPRNYGLLASVRDVNVYFHYVIKRILKLGT